MSDSAPGEVIIVAAPSGAGKTSLVNALVERVDLLTGTDAVERVFVGSLATIAPTLN